MISLLVAMILVSDGIGTAHVPLLWLVLRRMNCLMQWIDDAVRQVMFVEPVGCLRLSLRSDDVSFIEIGSRLFFL